MYAEFATDPKVQSMPEAMQRRLAMLFCFECSGDLPKLDDDELAIAMKITPAELSKTRDLFIRKGFIGDTWTPKNWEKRQTPADRTAAERMRRLRERQREQERNVTRNGPVTSPSRSSGAGAGAGAGEEAEAESEAEQRCAAAACEEGKEPEYPEPDGMHMIMPGRHEIPDATARQIWSLLWKGWGDRKLCVGFYEHQRFYSEAAWREAIRVVAAKSVKPGTIKYLERIAADADANGVRVDEPLRGQANPRQSREPPPKVPVKPKRPDLPRNAETEAIHAMWDRAEREDAERAAKLARQGVAG